MLLTMQKLTLQLFSSNFINLLYFNALCRHSLVPGVVLVCGGFGLFLKLQGFSLDLIL